LNLTSNSYVCINNVVKRKLLGEAAEDGETAERLLNAAEQLFGELGYDAVGMRLLADKAGVNLGAATYHFGSKERLYIETFMRRFRPTNAERLHLLREAEARAKGSLLSVETIVECMLRPPFESGLKHPAFHRFLARNLLMPPPFIHPFIIQEIEPGMNVFVATLRRSLPELPEDLVHLRSMFAMGSLLMFSIHASEMPGMNNPKLHEPVLQEIIRYVSAGFKSQAAVPSSERPKLPGPPKMPKT
jgi:AcrR family transcriptional regulator